MMMAAARKVTNSRRGNKVVDEIIGGNLRRMRVLKGMSQETLGDALGLTFQQVQKYEKGSNRIGGSRMVQICSVLGCEPRDLFFGTEADNGKQRPDEAMLILQSERGVRLARVFPKLPSEVQSSILTLCENFTPEQ